MFGFLRGKEQEHVTRWQNATWDTTPGFARNTPGKGGNDWDFSARLPEDADPLGVTLGYRSEESTDGEGVYTVSYRIREVCAWRLMEVYQVSESDNFLVNFSVHASAEDWERAVGLHNMDRSSTTKLDL